MAAATKQTRSETASPTSDFAGVGTRNLDCCRVDDLRIGCRLFRPRQAPGPREALAHPGLSAARAGQAATGFTSTLMIRISPDPTFSSECGGSASDHSTEPVATCVVDRAKPRWLEASST